MRKYVADTVAAITFSTVTAMTIEILIAGLTFGQSLQTRLVAIIPTTIFGRPFGIFRDWVFQKLQPASHVGKVLTDVCAFVCFQIPIYATNLAFSGATLGQIATACTTLTCASAFIGRPYGLSIEFSRRMFGA